MNFKKIFCLLGLSLGLQTSGFAATQLPLSIPEDYAAEEAAVSFKSDGPTLLFSDSPETVYQNGILYRDTVQGRVRLFFHHVNGVEGTKKLAVLLKNEGLRPVRYRLTRGGMGGYSYDYMRDGKESQENYFSDDKQKPREGELRFGRTAELISGRGALLEQDKLLTGTLDLELDGPTQVSVLMCEPQADIELFNEQAAILPMDEHPLRGTFANSDWNYTLDKKINGKQPVKLKLAGEGYAQGVDATTGLPAENYGNYGVIYKVNFTVAAKKPVSFILNPIGGYFAGYGVLEQKGKRELLALPEYDVSLGGTIEEAVELGKLRSGKYSFIWSPPGASNLPIELIWR